MRRDAGAARAKTSSGETRRASPAKTRFPKIQTEEVSRFRQTGAACAISRPTMARLERGVIGSSRARTIRVRPILYMRWACGRGGVHARTTCQRVRGGPRGVRTDVGRLAGALLHARARERKMRRVAARAFDSGTHEVRQQGPHSQEGREVLDDRHGDDARAQRRLRARDSAVCFYRQTVR